LVLDAWAGVAERATGRPVDGNTLFTVYSVSKGIVATCVHMLAERKLLDYDAPVARYWPAFGSRGKERSWPLAGPLVLP
jgi:CubicO group peptidase (beta-lactamase class C family)